MSNANTLRQAKTIANLLPTLMRQLFAGEDGPAAAMTLAQLRACGVLYHGRRTMSELGRELGISLSATTQLADRLERARLVSRVADDADRRVRCLQLTPRGEKIMRLRESARVRRVSAALKHLNAKTRKESLAALEALIRASLAARNHNGAAKPARSKVHR